MPSTQLVPPVAPMLAKAAKEVPASTGATGYLYEPKWDGFRCLLFVGDGVEVSGRSESLTRYFPEIVAAASDQLSARVAATASEALGHKVEITSFTLTFSDDDLKALKS